jgi:hypothetical protein
MKNFIGQDGFVWWIGIVEDINDPLTLGRCKVRCFGYHPAKSTSLVSTEDLPFALSIHPLNTPNLYGTPKLGDWVFGFFLDSLSAQEPAILGYLPAIPEAASEYFGTAPNLTRNFARVNTANNSANTICWEIGNNIVEVVTQSSTEANGHILIQHKTGAKVNIDSDGKISIYTPTNDISIEATDGDINLNAKNINLTASESIAITSTLATSVVAGGLASITAGGAFTATAGAFMSMTSIGNMTAKTIAGILNIESAAALNVIAGSVLSATAVGSLTAQAPVLTITDAGNSWTPSSIAADQARQDAEPSGFALAIAASSIFGS